jgi:hypothetical protein
MVGVPEATNRGVQYHVLPDDPFNRPGYATPMSLSLGDGGLTCCNSQASTRSAWSEKSQRK